ncbi:phage tail assembly chaperone [Candidatus Avoscillospira sp. LCP25S3_F1]|uniref:phage tail assembly chaperone n=1 Tax=Candidatus Avoscillospira sp. LCP25S3_F1 TaxID=3438825 RepID=UPI003F8DB297
MSVLDILLAGTARNVQKTPQEQDYKVLRLSEELGQDVVFKLRGLSYNKCHELAEREETDVWTALAGVAEPDLQDPRLAVQYDLLQEGEAWGRHGVTPPDLVKAMLLPGEISALSRAIQQLSGYRTISLEAVKKN